mmetsp:Transcript_65279/g.187820  ORF Transcript_65279/g.187820 Transcript_65279/m.187820 type:complete len:207 (+) Transcript_65279:766-1386(+)
MGELVGQPSPNLPPQVLAIWGGPAQIGLVLQAGDAVETGLGEEPIPSRLLLHCVHGQGKYEPQAEAHDALQEHEPRNPLAADDASHVLALGCILLGLTPLHIVRGHIGYLRLDQIMLLAAAGGPPEHGRLQQLLAQHVGLDVVGSELAPAVILEAQLPEPVLEEQPDIPIGELVKRDAPMALLARTLLLRPIKLGHGRGHFQTRLV